MHYIHIVPFVFIQMWSFLLHSQEPDTARRGIHQIESEQHRWDVLKMDSGIPAFLRGKEYAFKKEWRLAKKEFLGAVKYNAADAYFNLGILSYHQEKLFEAIIYLKKSFSLKNDSLTHWYLDEVQRRFPTLK
jgi:hypothetical protein